MMDEIPAAVAGMTFWGDILSSSALFLKIKKKVILNVLIKQPPPREKQAPTLGKCSSFRLHILLIPNAPMWFLSVWRERQYWCACSHVGKQKHLSNWAVVPLKPFLRRDEWRGPTMWHVQTRYEICSTARQRRFRGHQGAEYTRIRPSVTKRRFLASLPLAFQMLFQTWLQIKTIYPVLHC